MVQPNCNAVFGREIAFHDSMESFLQFWPVIAFMCSLFVGGLGIAIGLTMWIMGRLSDQDGKRTEVKEAILVEVRDRHHKVMSGMDMRHEVACEKIDELGKEVHQQSNRLTRVETVLNGKLSGNGN